MNQSVRPVPVAGALGDCSPTKGDFTVSSWPRVPLKAWLDHVHPVSSPHRVSVVYVTWWADHHIWGPPQGGPHGSAHLGRITLVVTRSPRERSDGRRGEADGGRGDGRTTIRSVEVDGKEARATRLLFNDARASLRRGRHERSSGRPTPKEALRNSMIRLSG